MPNQSLLYTGRVLRLLAAAGDDAHRPRAVRRADLRHARRGDVPPAPRRRPGWRSSTRSTSDWEAEDRRKLLAFARDLLNSDYAGHRLTFQLFAQSPPFANLAAVYRNFDLDGAAGPRHGSAPPGCPDERGAGDWTAVVAVTPHAASGPSTRATPTPSRSSTTTSARRSSPATRSTCAVRSARTSTRAESVGVGDVAAQTERAMANVAQLLERVPAPRSRTSCKIVVYLIDIRYREPVYRVHRAAGSKGVLPGLDRRRGRRRWRARSGWSRSTSTAVIAR